MWGDRQTLFQFTHPCGCDKWAFNLAPIEDVSIHAPVWVRRTQPKERNQNNEVSIHAPVWVRLSSVDESPYSTLVSIHAPVWVRQDKVSRPGSMYLFQFTHPCGCDRKREARQAYLSGFNSRTRVGATFPVILIPQLARFQFTHPCGCDPCLGKYRQQGMVSIHAPVWVRLHGCNGMTHRPLFQFTHPCGCDYL